jgi:anti-sigma B factor antagonist
MNIEITDLGISYYVIIKGSIEMMNVKNLKDQLIDLELNSSKDFEFDLSDVDYIDSSGISVFLILYKNLKEKGKKIYIRKFNDKVYNVLKMSSLIELFGL